MDALPYPAFQLEISGFPFKARYVNDVHLPRFGHDPNDNFGLTDFVILNAPLYGTATRSQMHRGRFKGFLPLEQLE